MTPSGIELATFRFVEMVELKLKGKSVPLQAWSGPECSRNLRFPDFKTTAQDGGKVVSLTHRPPLPPGNALGTHFCWRLSRSQGHCPIGRIMSMTPFGIEPATSRFVAQHFNHCVTTVPVLSSILFKKTHIKLFNKIFCSHRKLGQRLFSLRLNEHVTGKNFTLQNMQTQNC